MCLKDSCFQIVGRSHRWSLYIIMLWEKSTAKNYRPVSLLFVISKIFEIRVNNRILDHLQKCGLFSDFQDGFRSSRSTAGFLTVVSDRIAWAFKPFDRIWHAGVLHKRKSFKRMEFQVRYLALFLLVSVIDGFEWFWMKYLKAPFLVLHFSYYTLMTCLMMLSVILASMLMIVLFALSVIRHLICRNN